MLKPQKSINSMIEEMGNLGKQVNKKTSYLNNNHRGRSVVKYERKMNIRAPKVTLDSNNDPYQYQSYYAKDMGRKSLGLKSRDSSLTSETTKATRTRPSILNKPPTV